MYTDINLFLQTIVNIEKGLIDNFEKLTWSNPYEYGDDPYDFEYKLNSDGLRSIEFNEKYDIITAGCSLTYGIGIPQEGMWSNILSNMTGTKIANVGYPGRSTDTIIRTVIKLLAINKPKIIICFFPNFERCNIVENNIMYATNTGNENFYYKKNQSIEKILPMEWARENAYQHITMLEHICKMLDIKLIWSTWSISNLSFSDRLNKFNNYIKDTTINDFPVYGQWNKWTENEQERKNLFIYPNMTCHLDHKLASSKYYNYGGDSAMRSGDYGKGFCPHPGIHRNIHWAEFFYDKIKEQ